MSGLNLELVIWSSIVGQEKKEENSGCRQA